MSSRAAAEVSPPELGRRKPNNPAILRFALPCRCHRWQGDCWNRHCRPPAAVRVFPPPPAAARLKCCGAAAGATPPSTLPWLLLTPPCSFTNEQECPDVCGSCYEDGTCEYCGPGTMQVGNASSTGAVTCVKCQDPLCVE